MSDNQETPQKAEKFDFSAYPEDTLFYERRTGSERRDLPARPGMAKGPRPERAPSERRARKERRRRIDPTTFEKQYTEDEIEFMNAMQNFKVQTGKAFPTYGEVLKVAFSLGYLQYEPFDDCADGEDDPEPVHDLKSLNWSD